MRCMVAVILVAIVLAGCAMPAPQAPSSGSDARSSRPTVVALIDSGANPYHAVFAAGDPQPLGNLATAEPVSLSKNGTYQERVDADHATWQKLRRGQLYSFAGTRLMAISFLPQSDAPSILDQNGHGSGTSSLVARYAPDVVIVVVQVDGSICQNATCLNNPTFAQGLAWAADQPWIDVVSISANFPANTPDTSAAHAEMAAYMAASRRAHETGKLIVNSAGNFFVPTLSDYFNGPPWIIAVGGVQSTQHGESPDSSKGIDVVANYTDIIARPSSTSDFTIFSGTSVSTPIVSGVLAEALAQARQNASGRSSPLAGEVAGMHAGRDVHTDARNLRDALNSSARLFAPTEYSPWNEPTNDTGRNVLSTTLPIVAGPGQMGWGFVDGSTVARIVSCLLSSCEDPQPTPSTVAVQSRWQAAREEYWANAPRCAGVDLVSRLSPSPGVC